MSATLDIEISPFSEEISRFMGLPVYMTDPCLQNAPKRKSLRQSHLSLSAVRLRAVACQFRQSGCDGRIGGELVAADFAIVALATTAEKATSRPS